MRTSMFLVAAVTVLGVLGVSGKAHAVGQCGLWQVSNGGRDVVFGEALDSTNHPLGYLAICERTGSTTSFHAITTCTSGMGSTDYVTIYGGNGNDRIAPLQAATGIITCGGNKINPFNWSLALAASGGDGSDKVFGTNSPDTLVSNTFSQQSPSDGDGDMLCGFLGNDWLIGDLSNNHSLGNEECIDGGDSTNTCEAGYAASDSALGDVYVGGTCSTTTGGWWSTSATSCGGGCSSDVLFW